MPVSIVSIVSIDRLERESLWLSGIVRTTILRFLYLVLFLHTYRGHDVIGVVGVVGVIGVAAPLPLQGGIRTIRDVVAPECPPVGIPVTGDRPFPTDPNTDQLRYT
jgi:hypothetical protein